jgi:hypothetical protein
MRIRRLKTPLLILGICISLPIFCAPPVSPMQKIFNPKYSDAHPVYIVNTQITPNALTYNGEKATSISVDPTLPFGLSLNAQTGTISGTPVSLQARRHYIITVKNEYNSDTAGIDITISNPAPESLSYPVSTPRYSVGTPITMNVPVFQGGPVDSFSVSPDLPAGLAINKTNGAISGTPTQANPAATYNIIARNAAGGSQTTLVITISDTTPGIAPPESLSYAITSASYPVGKQIAVNTPSYKGGTPDSFTISPALPQGLAFSKTTGAISGIPAVIAPASICTVTATNAGGSAKTTLTIAVTDTAVVQANHKPSFVSGIDPVSAKEGDTAKIKIIVHDSDQTDAIVISLVNVAELKSTFGQSAIAWSTLKDTARLNILVGTHTGTVPITVKISDGKDSSSVTFNLTVGNVNHPPRWKIKIINAAIIENQTYSLNLPDTCTDPDGDPLTFSLKSGAPVTDMIGADSVYRFAAGYADSGHYVVTIIASDDSSLTDTLTINLAVANVDTDHTAPAIKLFDPAADSSITAVSSRLVKIVVKDQSNLSRVVFVFTDTIAAGRSQDSIWSATVTNLHAGYNDITVLAWDSSANRNKSQMHLFLRYDPTASDVTPPVIRLLDPAKDSSICPSSSRVVKISASDAGKIARVAFFAGDTIAATHLSDSTWSATVAGLTAGRYTAIKALAWDSSSNANRAEKVVYVKYDATSPAISISSPSLTKDSAVTTSSPANIAGSASSPFGIARVVVRVNGSLISDTLKQNWGCQAALNGAQWNTIIVTAIDSIGATSRDTTIRTLTLFYKPTVSMPDTPDVASSLCDSIQLSCSAVQYCTRYSLYRSVSGPTGTFSLIAGPQAAMTFTDKNVAAGMAYYKIRASYTAAGGSFNVNDSSAFSAVRVVAPPCWQKVYGGATDDMGYAVAQCRDGGYLVAGVTNNAFNGYIIRTSPVGDTLWTKVVAQTGYERFYSAIQCKDSGFVVAGTDGWQPLLLRIREDGSIAWRKIYLSQNGEAKCVIEKNSGGFALAGTVFGPSNKDMFVLRLNTGGDSLASAIFDNGNDEEFKSVVECPDGGYMLAGNTSSLGLVFDLFFIRTNQSCAFQWQKQLDLGGKDYLSHIEPAGNGYIVCGQYNHFGYISLITPSCDTSWMHVYNETEDMFWVTPLGSGGYIACGASGPGTRDAFVVKVSDIGTTAQNWPKAIGGTGADAGNCIMPTPDGGYIVTGSTDSYGAGGQDVFLIKADANGNSTAHP